MLGVFALLDEHSLIRREDSPITSLLSVNCCLLLVLDRWSVLVVATLLLLREVAAESMVHLSLIESSNFLVGWRGHGHLGSTGYHIRAIVNHLGVDLD